MMYKNDRQGIIDEYTDKLASEASTIREGFSDKQNKILNNLQAHFIRGLVSDIVDRVAEDPDSFQTPPMELFENG